MTEFARINQPRVDKIMGILDQIEKSARSQKASREEVAALLTPILARIDPGEAPEADQHAPEPRGPKPPPVADPDFEAALEAVRNMPYGRVRQVTDAVPELLVVPVITSLVYRLADRPLPQPAD